MMLSSKYWSPLQIAPKVDSKTWICNPPSAFLPSICLHVTLVGNPQMFFSWVEVIGDFLKLHLHGRLFCDAIRRFFPLKIFLAEWLLKRCETRLSPGPPRGGAGGTMTPGPMDFRGPMGFRKAVGFRGHMSSRGAHRNDFEKLACEA